MIGSESGPHKIGMSANGPQARLASLQTGCPTRLSLIAFVPVPDGMARDVEKRAHRLLDPKRLGGEWFEVTAKQAIEAVEIAAGRACEYPTAEMTPVAITGGQMRAARALLRWTTEKLAERSGVGLATIKRAEASDGEVRVIPANLAAVQRALEAGGIEFISANGGGVGVRLRGRVEADER